MPATLSRWGNSLAVRIPAQIACKAKLAEGDAMELSVSRAGHLVMVPLAKPDALAASQAIDFSALYEQIAVDARYAEVGAGGEVGAERNVW